MFTSMVLLAFLPIILTQSSNDEVVMVDVLRPRAASTQAFNAELRKFWTRKQLLTAIPLNRTFPDAPQIPTNSGRSVTSNGQPVMFPGVLPSAAQRAKAIVSDGRQVLTTGRVFWTDNVYQYSCSAVVVPSQTGDLICTAGHCAYDNTKRQWYTNNKWVFIPAYSNGNAPYGIWPARRMVALSGWTSYGDLNSDIAFVALDRVNNRSVQSTVGSQGIAFNQPRLASMYSFGYPANINNGETLSQCSGIAQRTPIFFYGGQGLSCNMTAGCSGGPWLQNVNETTGGGFVTSLNSFTMTTFPNRIFGPYFGFAAQTLYRSARKM